MENITRHTLFGGAHEEHSRAIRRLRAGSSCRCLCCRFGRGSSALRKQERGIEVQLGRRAVGIVASKLQDGGGCRGQTVALCGRVEDQRQAAAKLELVLLRSCGVDGGGDGLEALIDRVLDGLGLDRGRPGRGDQVAEVLVVECRDHVDHRGPRDWVYRGHLGHTLVLVLEIVLKHAHTGKYLPRLELQVYQFLSSLDPRVSKLGLV